MGLSNRVFLLLFFIANLLQAFLIPKYPSRQYIRLSAAATSEDSPDGSDYWSGKEDYILSGEVALKEKFIELEKENKRLTEIKEKEDEEIKAIMQENERKKEAYSAANKVGAEKDFYGTNSEKNEKKTIPFFDIDSIGVRGRWIERSGNFLLIPLDEAGDELTQPAGVIHFLGGAFVGDYNSNL
jgi:hypothetical protein